MKFVLSLLVVALLSAQGFAQGIAYSVVVKNAAVKSTYFWCKNLLPGTDTKTDPSDGSQYHVTTVGTDAVAVKTVSAKVEVDGQDEENYVQAKGDARSSTPAISSEVPYPEVFAQIEAHNQCLARTVATPTVDLSATTWASARNTGQWDVVDNPTNYPYVTVWGILRFDVDSTVAQCNPDSYTTLFIEFGDADETATSEITATWDPFNQEWTLSGHYNVVNGLQNVSVDINPTDEPLPGGFGALNNWSQLHTHRQQSNKRIEWDVKMNWDSPNGNYLSALTLTASNYNGAQNKTIDTVCKGSVQVYAMLFW